MASSTEIKTCQACGKPLKGRSDKKFCDDYCRNAYNNQLKSTSNNYVRNINNALGKNRRILEGIFPPGEKMTKTTKEKLQRLGFQFKYFTHTYTNKKEISIISVMNMVPAAGSRLVPDRH
jgi:hypothetical protein